MKKIIQKKSLVALACLLLSIGFGIGPSWGAWGGTKPVGALLEGGGSEGGGTPSIPLLAQISTVNASGNGYVYDMQLVGNLLYTGNKFSDPVLNVSNPRNPVKLYEIPHMYSASHYGIKVVDNKYYGLGNALDIWDASTLGYLGGIWTYYDPQYDLDVVDNKAYTITDIDSGNMAGQSGILDVWNVSDPANIVPLGHEVWSEYPFGPHPPNPTNVLVEGPYAYIGMEGLRIYNISDPVNPTFVGRFDAKDYVDNRYVHGQDDMVKVGNLIFKAHRSFGIIVIDVRFPAYPTLAALIGEPTIALGDAIAFNIVGNRAFVATAKDRQFKVLNITDVRNPHVMGSADISGLFETPEGEDVLALSVEVVEGRDLAFVGGECALNIYDVDLFIPDRLMD